MNRAYLYLVGLMIILAACLSWGMTPETTKNYADKNEFHVKQMIYNMKEFYASVYDYSSIFIKQERQKDKLTEPEKIKVYFKKPFNLRMEWIEGPNKGRQLIYRQGYNDDKMLVKYNFFLGSRVFAIEPNSKLAMKNSRHSVTEMGFGYLIELLTRNVRRAENNSELRLVYHGEQEIYGRTVYKVEGILPLDESKGYYCYRAIVGIDKEYGLPISVETYSWDNRLSERYLYTKLRTNIGIDDDIFESID